MASKCCRDKAVVVAVYTEKPKQYHRVHEKGSRIDGKRGRGYSRRAELLDYSRHLRTPTHSIHSPSSHNKRLSSSIQVLDVDGTRKKKHSSPPNCFDTWDFVLTKFIKSNQTRNHKKKNLVKGFQKKVAFFSKLLAALHKRRR